MKLQVYIYSELWLYLTELTFYFMTPIALVNVHGDTLQCFNLLTLVTTLTWANND